MIRYIVFIALFCFFLPTVHAQFFGGPTMDDGKTYKANKIVNKQPDFSVVNIQQISLGNGVQVYKDIDKRMYISGDYYIQIYPSLYALATFNKGILQKDYQEYRDKSLDKKYFYKNGLLEGVQETFYTEGGKRSVSQYKNGIILSRTDFHQNGQIAQDEKYDEQGRRNGVIVAYDSDGKKKSESNYGHGSLQGRSVEYDKDGATKVTYYKDSRAEGEYKLIYANGKTKTEGLNNSNSNKEGKWTEYYDNGNLKNEIFYTDGIKDGVDIAYYENGKIKSSAEYKKGLKNGAYKEYNESPYVLLTESSYKDDRLDGIYKGYNEGKIWRDCIYKDGKLISEKQYLNGVLSVLKMLDQYGNLVDVRKYDAAGKSTYQNKSYKKNKDVRLVEDDYGIIDID